MSFEPGDIIKIKEGVSIVKLNLRCNMFQEGKTWKEGQRRLSEEDRYLFIDMGCNEVSSVGWMNVLFEERVYKIYIGTLTKGLGFFDLAFEKVC